MLSKLKRHAILQLSLTIFLTISVLMTVYYLFYSQIMYRDYTDKASALAEMYSQNINNYLKQIDKDITTFAKFFDAYTAENNDRVNMDSQLSSILTNIMKYRYNPAIYDIAIVLNSGEFITQNNYLNIEAVKNTGILDALSVQPAYMYYDPNVCFYTNTCGNYFLYGKTIYDSSDTPLFSVISAIQTAAFSQKISTETYFTKDVSIYIVFDNAYLTVTENDKTKSEVISSDNPKNYSKKRNIKSIELHNTNYDFNVVTNFNASDNTTFVSSLTAVFVLLCIASGILGLVFSRKIVRHIIYPLEKTYIKINKNAFK